MRLTGANGLRLLIVVWTAGLLAFVALGCGSGGGSQVAGTVVPISEGDFHIGAPTHLTAGEYTLRVHNEGPTEHELIVVPYSSWHLPIRADGLTVSEETIQTREVGSLEPGHPGALRYLQLHLAPGRYVLFCNMEGHFMAGMHDELVVSA
jgi:uncharacterized cupredoxin-like copper-binding protein